MGIFKNSKPNNVFRGKKKAIKYSKKSNRNTTQSDLLRLYAAGTLKETQGKFFENSIRGFQVMKNVRI